MTISSALANANSGLSVASRRASVVSNNVANALTPGYARRDVDVGERVIAGRGAGVSVNGITRAQDKALTFDRRVAESAASRDQEVAAANRKLNSALGEPGDAFSLFAQYQGLESSLRSLALTPESIPLQAQVLDAAKSLTTRFNQLTTQTQTMRSDADGKIAQQVSTVNANLAQIEKLNLQISRGANSGQDTTGLEDQRKQLIDEISGVIPVREIARDNNKVDLMTNEGVFLLAGSARPVEFTRASVVNVNTSLAGGQLSGLSVGGIDITPGGAGSFSLSQGSITGLFEVRDQIAAGFQDKLDALSRDVIERFESADPSLAPGAAGLFTDNGSAFDPTMQLGLAGRIAVNTAVDPAQGGDLWRLRDGIGAAAEGAAGNADIIFMLLDNLSALRPPPPGSGLSSQGTALDAIANVNSAIGAARLTSESRLAASSANTQALIDAEQTITAVDTDFEMQQLLVIEQAFAANARVIQVASDMLNTLMEL